jgi:hypothetical protein
MNRLLGWEYVNIVTDTNTVLCRMEPTPSGRHYIGHNHKHVVCLHVASGKLWLGNDEAKWQGITPQMLRIAQETPTPPEPPRKQCQALAGCSWATGSAPQIYNESNQLTVHSPTTEEGSQCSGTN